MENQQLSKLSSDQWKVCESITRVTSIHQMLTCQGKNIQHLSRQFPTQTEGWIAMKTLQFLAVNSSGEDHSPQAVQFAQDVMDTRPDWKLETVDFFFRFIRQRQDIPEMRIFGNRITAIKLMEMVGIYEDHIAQAREELLAKRYKNQPDESRSPSCDPQMVREKIQKIISTIKAPEKMIINHLAQSQEDKDYQIAVSDHSPKSVNEITQNFIKEFDEFSKEQGFPADGDVRIIEVSGRKMTINDFLIYRMGLE